MPDAHHNRLHINALPAASLSSEGQFRRRRAVSNGRHRGNRLRALIPENSSQTNQLMANACRTPCGFDETLDRERKGKIKCKVAVLDQRVHF